MGRWPPNRKPINVVLTEKAILPYLRLPPPTVSQTTRIRRRESGEPVDLRFQSADETSERSGSRRKERKKAYKEAKKKKKSSDQPDGDFPFPGHDKVEFGDLVDQTPRLAILPKVTKFFKDT